MLILAGILGLILGSFVNAVVWRLHQNQESRIKNQAKKNAYSITHGRSMCPNCKHPLGTFDLIPVLSWLFLGGKCRYCHKPIAVQYPIVELLTAGLFGLSFQVLAPQASSDWLYFGFWLYILVVLIILAVYDLRWMLLPDVVLLPAIGVTAGYLFVEVLAHQPLSVTTSALIAGFGAGAVFYFIAAITRGKGMGGGDIKLVFLMGLLLGLPKMLVALFLAFTTAALVGVILIAIAHLRHAKRPRYIAFGPFLIGATIVAQLSGQQVINFYLHASGL